MAIDIKEYTPRKRKHLRTVKACCLYVIGEAEGGPMKIGIAGDIVQRFKQIDQGGVAEHKLHYVMWTPGRPVAQRIENYVHSLMFRAGRAVKGEWFNIDLASAKMTIDWAARQLYPHASLYSHAKIIAQLDKKLMEKPRRPSAVDSLQQINDIPQIPELIGSVSSASGAFTNTFADLSEVLAGEGSLLAINAE